MFPPLNLKINCGYARAAIFELRDDDHRATQFQTIFSRFKLPEKYFDMRNNGHSTFDDHCKAISNTLKKKWLTISRDRYLAFFSITNWKVLTDIAKEKHTIASCNGCSIMHNDYQKAFPGKPVYIGPPPIVSLNLDSVSISEKEECKLALKELNVQWEGKYDHTLSSVLPILVPAENLTFKQTKSERKRTDRIVKRKLVGEINRKIGETSTLTMLAEAESVGSYTRKRMSMSFETPAVTNKRHKSHSPSDENQLWQHENAMKFLEEFPTNETINWTKSAKELQIPGANKGQVLKEYASNKGIDTARLEHRQAPKHPTVRRAKKKLTGKEISVPCLPTPNAVKAEKEALISSGQLTIGEPCSPYTILKSVVTEDGDVETVPVRLVGRKIPLIELRKSLLKKHKRCMRLNTDTELNNMSEDHIRQLLAQAHHEVPPEYTLQQLRLDLKTMQRTRNLAIWHDHSTILKTGYILFAVWVVYDPIVFLTELECKQTNIQEFVEQPVIYMISPCSSSPSDQIALIGDRIECLQEISTAVTACNGVTLNDRMRFFCGDKPAQQFERGTQIGGCYKCGGCGCKDTMMQDLAHAFHCKWRSLSDLQHLVLDGKFGCTRNKLKPFDNLKVDDLRLELNQRGYNTTHKKKPELQDALTGILKGAQRVPTLLTLDPSQSLSSLNLSHYEVMDCEPLHDLKGHINHLLKELPYILPAPLNQQCTQIIETTAPKPANGAQLRLACLKVYLKLHKENLTPDNTVINLLETIVKISETLYNRDSARTPKAILQLYNATWLHHELCCDLIGTPRESSFYGAYLHDLIVHAPPQYQLVCLRSTNAESQERLFSQAKHVSLRATNRKPENVLTNILLSMQAREQTNTLQDSIKNQESIVAVAAKRLPKFSGTKISTDYITTHINSWQAHLKRISPYLQFGEGVWWKRVSGYFQFLDADKDPESNTKGPQLTHFRSCNMKDIDERQENAWQHILQRKVSLPTVHIRLFDNAGNYTGRRYFHEFSEETDSSPDFSYTPLSQSSAATSPTHQLQLQPPAQGAATQLQPPAQGAATSTTLTQQLHLQSPAQGAATQLQPPAQGAATSTTLTQQLHLQSPAQGAATQLQPPAQGAATQLQLRSSFQNIVPMSTPSRKQRTKSKVSRLQTISSPITPPIIANEQNVTIDTTLQLNTHSSLKTSAARQLEKAIGTTDTLISFDKLRQQLKMKTANKKRVPYSEQEEYKTLLARIHTAIVSRKYQLKSELRAVELENYRKTGSYQTTEDSDYITLRQMLDFNKKILGLWHSFTLT